LVWGLGRPYFGLVIIGPKKGIWGPWTFQRKGGLKALRVKKGRPFNSFITQLTERNWKVG